MVILTGIVGILLGLLFGWMRHQTVLNWARDEVDWEAVWDAALDLPEERFVQAGSYAAPRCTCGTSAVCPIHERGYYDNSPTHMRK